MKRIDAPTIWKIGAFDNRVRSHVALEQQASWPIPTQSDNVPTYCFFYNTIHVRPGEPTYAIWPPSWVARVRAADGAITGPDPIVPADVGLDVPAGRPFANHAWPKSWTWPTGDKKREELLAAYDPVVDAWLTGDSSASFTDFRARFHALTPPPLLPCYRHLGEAFFAWLMA